MAIIITLTALSFTASSFVIAACALSSRLSQREGLDECYIEQDEPTLPVKSVAPISLN
ncbi:MAG: hypothetical protein H6657_01705 [Ardenticatenaceae bacterium]|nr:hypothetical protein [Ardenticatenaceae bacterium]